MKKKLLVVLSLFFVGIYRIGFLPTTSMAFAEDKKQLYTCPMHPQVKTEHPGECPICHMKLVPIQSANAEEAPNAEKKIKFYRNPMNPAITSKVPAKDEMGMDYIPVYEDENTSSAQSINGRSSFEINSTQAGNLYLKPVKVGIQDLNQNLNASARVVGGSSVAIQVLEADALKVKAGQNFLFKSLSRNKEFKGKIVAVDSALDPMSRTVRVTGALSNSSGLRSESSGTAVIEAKLGSGVFVPEEAVLRTGQDDLVYVVVKNRISPRKVRLGAKVDGGFQVLSGLEAGEEISAGPNFLIDSEARIRGVHD